LFFKIRPTWQSYKSSLHHPGKPPLFSMNGKLTIPYQDAKTHPSKAYPITLGSLSPFIRDALTAEFYWD